MNQRHSWASCNDRVKEITVGLLLLGVYLITHGTTFGWDDHHLEIPLLKSLIDPELYPRDYYVASLKSHFPSLLYPILARLIPSTDLIPPVYRVLFIISRGAMFYFWYRIWRSVFGSRWMGFAAVWASIVLVRVPEFLYRTFSHQETALAILAAALYMFYRRRPIAAAFIAGFAANFHALYAGFVMTYILADVMLNRSFGSIKKRILSLGTATAAFMVAAAGVLIIIIKQLSWSWMNTADNDWLDLYRLACPQNFLLRGQGLSFFHNHPVSEILTVLGPFLLTFWLWGLLESTSPFFRRDRTSRLIVTAAACQWGVSVLFTDIIPIRFIVDLNMIRHIQFMQWVLFAHLIRFLPWLWLRLNPIATAASVAGLFLLRMSGVHSVAGLCLLTAPTTLKGCNKNKMSRMILAGAGWGAAFISTVWLVAGCLSHPSQRPVLCWSCLIAVISGMIWFACRRGRPQHDLRRIAWAIMAGLLFIRTVQLGLYHVRRLHIEQTSQGFWALQRAWIDVQRATKQRTPKNALILVPYDMEMGGFRIFSERSIVFSYRDSGIIGFDEATGREWMRRYRLLEPYRVIPRGDVRSAVVNALRLYRPDHIVTSPFVRLAPADLFEKIYTNGVFTLYRIRYDRRQSQPRTLTR